MMLRTLSRSTSAAMRSWTRSNSTLSSRYAVARIATPRVQTARPLVAVQAIRYYSAGASLKKEEVEGRILDLLKGFDKVKDISKLSQSSHFANDLGLDSLDTVEVVMAIEEEFSIEIPDKEADAIHSVNQAVDYILHQPDAQ